ncbi:hydrogenase maturation nickel metallochaperone HypA [Clostridium sp. BNL1100]|uniref:hydrogenase maturation nickel metallochaperone HypA n=1 Tax=Clostridium sp. BNL1100 TaxID=755731 RepID=UPI001FA7096C|nr:hydrogenase maturation nickel metallochaperone HypA [Clostridium sp. BNL1100]
MDVHEYAVTQSMLKLVLDEAKRVKASKILEIRLVIGDLSTIVDDSVQMYFDIMSEGTIAHGAKLVFRRVKAEFKCKECGEVFIKPTTGFDCPKCGGLGMPTGVGREFYIESLEIE